MWRRRCRGGRLKFLRFFILVKLIYDGERSGALTNIHLKSLLVNIIQRTYILSSFRWRVAVGMQEFPPINPDLDNVREEAHEGDDGQPW